MARGAHGWPSLHICRAAGEANIDEVNRAHRGQYHEVNMPISTSARWILYLIFNSLSLFSTNKECLSLSEMKRNTQTLRAFLYLSLFSLVTVWLKFTQEMSRAGCNKLTLRAQFPNKGMQVTWKCIFPVVFFLGLKHPKSAWSSSLWRSTAMEGGSKPRFGDVSDGTLCRWKPKLATRTQPGLRPRGFGLLATAEARRAWRYPSHVVVLKTGNVSRKILRRSEAQERYRLWIQQELLPCRTSGYATKFASAEAIFQHFYHRGVRTPANWDSRRRVERPQEGRLGKAGQTQESNFRWRLGKDQQVFWRRPRRANTSEADRIPLVGHYQPLVPTSMRGPKRVAERCLIFETSSNGDTSVRLGADFMFKNCPGGINGREFSSCGRITARLQVSALRLLLDNLHPSVDRLFQQAHPPFKSSDKVWFMKGPLGHNLLAKRMLSWISKKFNCSKKRLCLRKEKSTPAWCCISVGQFWTLFFVSVSLFQTFFTA